MSVVIDEQEIQQQIQMDAKNVDRLSERAYCRDFSRLGFGSLTQQSRSRSEPFRLTMVNSAYALCATYVVSSEPFRLTTANIWHIGPPWDVVVCLRKLLPDLFVA